MRSNMKRCGYSGILQHPTANDNKWKMHKLIKINDGPLHSAMLRDESQLVAMLSIQLC